MQGPYTEGTHKAPIQRGFVHTYIYTHMHIQSLFPQIKEVLNKAHIERRFCTHIHIHVCIFLFFFNLQIQGVLHKAPIERGSTIPYREGA